MSRSRGLSGSTWAPNAAEAEPTGSPALNSAKMQTNLMASQKGLQKEVLTPKTLGSPPSIAIPSATLQDAALSVPQLPTLPSTTPSTTLVSGGDDSSVKVGPNTQTCKTFSTKPTAI